jgi:two-component system, chemotaxis family, protein-glutamate methylesterase/glutaminase
MLYEIIVIGGSLGGIEASIEILKNLPSNYPVPIVLVLHRLRGNAGGLVNIFSNALNLKVKEVDEKEEIKNSSVYIAPANYHTLIESDRIFSLDYSETVNYSRPSIDVTFESASEVYGTKTLGIILTGNNSDGTSGLYKIAQKGGMVIVQDPAEAKAPTMPFSALTKVASAKTMKLLEISLLLQSL